MKFSQFAQELSHSQLLPVYLISTQEIFFTTRAISLIKKRFEDITETKEYTLLDAQTTHFSTILSHASTYPFFTPKQLIIVKNFDSTPKEAYDSYESYFNDPSEFTILLLCAEKIDKRLKFCTTASKKGFLHHFDQPKPYEIPNVIRQELRHTYNLSIDEDGTALLSELIGNNLHMLHSELEKLSLFVGNKPISVKDVADMIGNSSIVNNFKMVEYLAKKNVKLSLHMLIHMLNEQQEPPERLFGLLKWQFHRLYTAKKALTRGISITKICSDLKILPFHQENFISQLKIYDLQQLKNIYTALFYLDRNMKSTGINKNFLIEQLFWSVAL